MVSSFKYPNKCEYIGEWDKKGQRWGMGQFIFENGTEYFGSFREGLTSGLGIMYLADGSR